MQHDDKTTLCKSENGIISVFNNAVAYELRYKQVVTLLTGVQIQELKDELEKMKETDWFLMGNEKFFFFQFPQINGYFMLSEAEVNELLQLLLEASAMVKVYRKLFFKITPRIN